MTNLPSVSVVVPAYNVARYIARCLDSLLAQSSLPAEIIVVNDASIDATQDVIDRFVAEHTLIRCLTLTSNVGLGEARNIGMREARGEYLLFIDSDDWVDSRLVESIQHCVVSQPDVDVVLYRYARYYDETSIFVTPRTNNAPEASQGESLRSFFDYGLFAWNKAYRRVFVAANKLDFDRGFYEDIVWNYLVYSLANRVSVIHEVLYFYRYRQGSILNCQNKRHADLFKRYESLLALLQGGILAHELRQVLVDRMASHVVGLWMHNYARIPREQRRHFFHLSHDLIVKSVSICGSVSPKAFDSWSFVGRKYAELILSAITDAKFANVILLRNIWKFCSYLGLRMEKVFGRNS